MLSKLLASNPAYSDALAEQVLEQYVKIHRNRISRLESYGIELDDILQEMRITLWRQWNRWKPGGKINLQCWLSYRMRDALRTLEQTHFKRQPPSEQVSTEDLTEEQVDRIIDTDSPETFALIERREDLLHALSRLNHQQVACVALRYGLGYPIEDTARIIHLTPKQAKAQLHEALQKLSSFLQPPAPEGLQQ